MRKSTDNDSSNTRDEAVTKTGVQPSNSPTLHRKFNNLATIVVVVFALYIALLPYLPSLLFKYKQQHTDPSPYNHRLVKPDNPTKPIKPIPKDNRIVIPSALIDQPIYEGNNIGVINKGGVWHKKIRGTSPADPGNTVIIGHRWTYTTPYGPFYDLDKIHVGDVIAVYWEGKELQYKVAETTIVPPTAIYIENNTTDRTLTLYTCTPLLTASDRLVIVAKPIEEALSE